VEPIRGLIKAKTNERKAMVNVCWSFFAQTS
jgi:hypothetical protein